MKIVFINRFFYPDFSATSQILYDLTKNLAIASKELDLEIICSRNSYENKAIAYPKYEVIEGIKVNRVYTTNFGRVGIVGRALDYLSFYLFSAVKLLQLLNKKDLVVAKTDPPLMSVICAVVTKYKGAKLINWMQDVFPEVYLNLGYYCPYLMFRMLRAARNWSMRVADANIVLGVLMKKEFMRQGIRENSLHVIENWANEVVQLPIKARDSLLRKNLQLENKFVIAYSGNLGRAHEYHTLLDAAKLLINEKDFVFLIIGGGVGYEKLKKISIEDKVSNFIFLPYQKREDLSDVLAAGDVHLVSLLPELEGLIVPSKFYGILASARPLIMVGKLDGEISRKIDEDGYGAAVAVGDSEGLVKRLRSFKDNSENALLMGDRAYRSYQCSYTLKRAVNEWTSLIERLH